MVNKESKKQQETEKNNKYNKKYESEFYNLPEGYKITWVGIILLIITLLINLFISNSESYDFETYSLILKISGISQILGYILIFSGFALMLKSIYRKKWKCWFEIHLLISVKDRFIRYALVMILNLKV